MCIAPVCCPSCDVINFEINLIFLIKPFFTEKSKQNINDLRAKITFKSKIKAFAFIFKGLSVGKNCLRPEGVPLKGVISSE